MVNIATLINNVMSCDFMAQRYGFCL